jgi:hypothetical protein
MVVVSRFARRKTGAWPGRGVTKPCNGKLSVPEFRREERLQVPFFAIFALLPVNFTHFREDFSACIFLPKSSWLRSFFVLFVTFFCQNSFRCGFAALCSFAARIFLKSDDSSRLHFRKLSRGRDGASAVPGGFHPALCHELRSSQSHHPHGLDHTAQRRLSKACRLL